MDAEESGTGRHRQIHSESKQDSSPKGDRKAASMDMQQEQHPHSHLFTLRVWEEALGEGKVEWRGRVQEVASGETLFFRDWPGLIATLGRLIARTEVTAEGNPGERLLTHEKDE